jgi:hypothetical protein
MTASSGHLLGSILTVAVQYRGPLDHGPCALDLVAFSVSIVNSFGGNFVRNAISIQAPISN